MTKSHRFVSLLDVDGYFDCWPLHGRLITASAKITTIETINATTSDIKQIKNERPMAADGGRSKYLHREYQNLD